MSLDRSLKTGSSISKHRNVLKRAERIDRLKAVGKFTDDGLALGLPKVGNRKVVAGAKTAKKKDEAADGAAAPAAAAAKPAGKK